MILPGTFAPLWFAAGLLLLVPAVFVALCRQCLARVSRKELLERVPPERRDRLERSLSRRDEYQVSLELVEFVLLLLLTVTLVQGRIVAAESALRAQGMTWSSLTTGEQMVNLLILAVEILLVLGALVHVAPSVVARGWSEAVAMRFFPLIERLHSMLAPVRWLRRTVGRPIVFILAGRRERSEADIAQEELLSAMEEGEREGLLESRDVDMIESIITFGNVEVSEVLTPRTEMVALDLSDPVDENLKLAIECGHSRIPVYRETKDDICGMLYVKDLLKRFYLKEEIRLEHILRRPVFVPHTKKIGELFQEFKTHRNHVAIVLDEHGGTAGLVTIEDIIEEIVGDISDEFERDDADPIVRLSDDQFEVEGWVHIDDLNDTLGIEIPEGDSYDTVGGFLFSTLGRVPPVGHTVDVDGVRLEVTAADERRVQRLRIYLPGRGSSDSEANAPESGSMGAGGES